MVRERGHRQRVRRGDRRKETAGHAHILLRTARLTMQCRSSRSFAGVRRGMRAFRRSKTFAGRGRMERGERRLLATFSLVIGRESPEASFARCLFFRSSNFQKTFVQRQIVPNGILAKKNIVSLSAVSSSNHSGSESHLQNRARSTPRESERRKK